MKEGNVYGSATSTGRFSPRGHRPLSAFLMIFLLGMVAFAVDVGNICRVQTQTQAVADAAALAARQGAVRQLLAGAEPGDRLRATEQGEWAGGDLAELRRRAGHLEPDDADLHRGQRHRPGNACQATVSFTAARNNAVPTFLANLFGVQSVNVTSSAIAGGGAGT